MSQDLRRTYAKPTACFWFFRRLKPYTYAYARPTHRARNQDQGRAGGGCTSIANVISNPPFGSIERFIEHSLIVATEKVAILARLALLEGQRRRSLLEGTPMMRCWVFSRRVSMPPGDSDVPDRGGSVVDQGGAASYASAVWECI
jgi:hypothetical protein